MRIKQEKPIRDPYGLATGRDINKACKLRAKDKITSQLHTLKNTALLRPHSVAKNATQAVANESLLFPQLSARTTLAAVIPYQASSSMLNKLLHTIIN